jgi:TonB family protein
MRRHACSSIFVAWLIFAAGTAVAASIEDGQTAYNAGDYKTALEIWQPLAEQGNARAQNNLGVMYENGKGVPQNIVDAVKWYHLAAEQGYAGAQNNLGLIYAIGRGIQRDPIRAYMWFSLAAASLSGDLGATVAQSRDVFASAMSSRQIALAKDMAKKCQASNYKDCEPGAEALAADPDAQPAGPDTPAIPTTSHEVALTDYPSQSVRLHESGAVTVTYVIGEDGSVNSCTVILTSGVPRLDDAACSLVKRRWKYKPATEGGKPVTIQYISKIVFPRR